MASGRCIARHHSRNGPNSVRATQHGHATGGTKHTQRRGAQRSSPRQHTLLTWRVHSAAPPRASSGNPQPVQRSAPPGCPSTSLTCWPLPTMESHPAPTRSQTPPPHAMRQRIHTLLVHPRHQHTCPAVRTTGTYSRALIQIRQGENCVADALKRQERREVWSVAETVPGGGSALSAVRLVQYLAALLICTSHDTLPPSNQDPQTSSCPCSSHMPSCTPLYPDDRVESGQLEPNRDAHIVMTRGRPVHHPSTQPILPSERPCPTVASRHIIYAAVIASYFAMHWEPTPPPMNPGYDHQVRHHQLENAVPALRSFMERAQVLSLVVMFHSAALAQISSGLAGRGSGADCARQYPGRRTARAAKVTTNSERPLRPWLVDIATLHTKKRRLQTNKHTRIAYETESHICSVFM